MLLSLAVWQSGSIQTARGEDVSRTMPVRTPAAAAVHRKIDFAADIEPLLRKRCHRCHGPDVQEGGLRLDQRADALAGGGRGPALVPGKSDSSRIVLFAAGLDSERIVMPPEGPRLSADEIGLLRRLDRSRRGVARRQDKRRRERGRTLGL